MVSVTDKRESTAMQHVVSEEPDRANAPNCVAIRTSGIKGGKLNHNIADGPLTIVTRLPLSSPPFPPSLLRDGCFTGGQSGHCVQINDGKLGGARAATIPPAGNKSTPENKKQGDPFGDEMREDIIYVMFRFTIKHISLCQHAVAMPQSTKILVREMAIKYRTAIYLGAASIAEFFADILLTPLKATRIRMVSERGYATSLVSGFTRLSREAGVSQLSAGFLPILLQW
ncbi:uncharacterized protein BT62DRAFT_1011149 [Guyanagaster necrorhizus]|uniref:Uncharacterized protein n=1 Tax=Guyanagaster necrorhizus TaxID=856835 RepID=A0A9P7VJM9_9AGAR|nr:uncharacterized protein BT62DRAFT_1011149 [Guyanagaster necrorhizus MCA 3950]KAG7441842.1 hypothetical protein BT62DRAFT_1011149 [Guyanagaster necrorhizus MCA 3950]